MRNMVNNLILNKSGFPSSFYKIELGIFDKELKQKIIEEKLLETINTYNKKLDVRKVYYENLEDQFTSYQPSNKEGAICEDIEIESEEISYYTSRGYYVFDQDDKKIARNIIQYVFVTPPTEDGRNTLVSQMIFPTLIDYMGNYLDSPSYTPANHNFMIINIINKEITANSILRPLSALYAIGMDYIELFGPSIRSETIPKSLFEFIRKFDSNYNKNYDKNNNIYEYKYYRIDFSNKIFKIKTDELIKGIIINQNIESFHGSSEKFFWIETYPLSILAFNDSYYIDMTEYDQFIYDHKRKFKENNDKMNRCIYLQKYLHKYFSVR